MEHAKYQWSRFTDLSKIEQVVVRCDDFNEFVEAIKDALELLKQRQAESEPEPEIPPDQCIIHNAMMKKRQSKNGASWYDHRWQENGVWHVCNGKQTKTLHTTQERDAARIPS